MIKPTVETTIIIRTEAEGTVPLWFSIPAQETYALNFQQPRELNLIYDFLGGVGIFDYTFDLTFE
jgi:hypothetical protein